MAHPASPFLSVLILLLVAAVTAAAILVLSFLSGGYIFSRTATVVFVGVPLAAVWVWLVPRRLTLGGGDGVARRPCFYLPDTLRQAPSLVLRT